MASTTKYSQFAKDYLNHQGMLLASGEMQNLSTIFKFGHHAGVGSSFVPIATSGVYRTPAPSNATTLRIKAGGDAADAAAGSGAQEVTLQGLDENGLEVTETLATAGASASSSTTATFMRLYRAWVSELGTYQTNIAVTGQAAAITIEKTAGSEDWATIGATEGQTQICCFTTSAKQRGYLTDVGIYVATTKVVDLRVVTREGILSESDDLTAVRLILELQSAVGHIVMPVPNPIHIPPLTDLAVLGTVSASTAELSAHFSLVLNSAGLL